MYDVIIIGGGVIGAACAYSLSRYRLKVAMLERSNDLANGTTKANSAIIHAGYDPVPGTLMARLNVEGAAMAPDICRKLDVPYDQCGSLVLAFSQADLTHIQKLYDRGVANGVPGMSLLSAEEVRAMEPEVSEDVVGALLAPSAGIVCPWEYCLAMAEAAVRNGLELHRSTTVTGITHRENTYTIHTNRGDFSAAYVLDAAGLDAGSIHAMLEQPDYSITPTRGQYYLLDKSEGGRCRRTIFQCPSDKGKGVLVSPTVHGNLIVGPDAEVVEGNNCSTSAEALAMIAAAARRSIPAVDFRANIRNFAGVRANSSSEDFLIGQSAAHPGFFYLSGVKSPGLSAAPAIGEYMVKQLEKAGLPLTKKENFIDSRERIKFKELSLEEKNALIAKDPAYGRVICRCETITEGEIVAALRSPIPPLSINAVKRRCGAGMGRCQGGFCAPKVHEIMARELGLSMDAIPMEEADSWLLCGSTKEVAP